MGKYVPLVNGSITGLALPALGVWAFREPFALASCRPSYPGSSSFSGDSVPVSRHWKRAGKFGPTSQLALCRRYRIFRKISSQDIYRDYLYTRNNVGYSN